MENIVCDLPSDKDNNNNLLSCSLYKCLPCQSQCTVQGTVIKGRGEKWSYYSGHTCNLQPVKLNFSYVCCLALM